MDLSQSYCLPHGYMEAYSVFKTGNIFHAMGSFSYSGSSLPAYTQVGRYCAIASDVSVFATS